MSQSLNDKAKITGPYHQDSTMTVPGIEDTSGDIVSEEISLAFCC